MFKCSETATVGRTTNKKKKKNLNFCRETKKNEKKTREIII